MGGWMMGCQQAPTWGVAPAQQAQGRALRCLAWPQWQAPSTPGRSTRPQLQWQPQQQRQGPTCEDGVVPHDGLEAGCRWEAGCHSRHSVTRQGATTGTAGVPQQAQRESAGGGEESAGGGRVVGSGAGAWLGWDKQQPGQEFCAGCRHTAAAAAAGPLAHCIPSVMRGSGSGSTAYCCAGSAAGPLTHCIPRARTPKLR